MKIPKLNLTKRYPDTMPGWHILIRIRGWQLTKHGVFRWTKVDVTSSTTGKKTIRHEWRKVL